MTETNESKPDILKRLRGSSPGGTYAQLCYDAKAEIEERDAEIERLRAGGAETREVLLNIWTQAVRGIADSAIISDEMTIRPIHTLALVKQLADEHRDLLIRTAGLEEGRQEVEQLYVVFSHMHARRQDDPEDPDTCAECGLDIRNKVHFSEYAKKKTAARKRIR